MIRIAAENPDQPDVAALLDAISYKADRYSRGFAAHDKTGLWTREGK